MDSADEGFQRGGFAGAANGSLRHRPIVGVDDVHLVDRVAGAWGVQGDRQQAAGRGIGLDVERKHARRDRHLRRRDARILVDARDALAGTPLAANFAAAANVPVDEIAHGETHVRLEGGDAVGLQTIANRRRVLGRADVHAQRPAAVEGPLGDLELPTGAEARRPRRVFAPNVEVRRLPPVAHQERAAFLQGAVQMHHRSAADDPIARLQDEAARGLKGRLRCLAGRACALAGVYRHMCVPPQTAMAWPVT